MQPLRPTGAVLLSRATLTCQAGLRGMAKLDLHCATRGHDGRKPSGSMRAGKRVPRMPSFHRWCERAGRAMVDRANLLEAMRCVAAPRVRRALKPAGMFFAPGASARDTVALALDARQSRAGDRFRPAIRASRTPPSGPAPCAPTWTSPGHSEAEADAPVRIRRSSHKSGRCAVRDRHEHLPRALCCNSSGR